MSIKVMTWVWEHGPANGTERMLLLALADHCDDAGHAFPSMAGLAAKACVTERGARLIMRRLEASGWVKTRIGGGRGGKSQYQILMENPERETGNEKPGMANPEPECRKPGTTVQKPGTLVPPNHQEPSREPSERARKRASRLPSDWTLSAEDRAYALSKGLSDAKADREAEKFRNHWTAKSGRDATKLDWGATWRNWVLRDAPAPTATAAPADVSGLQAKTLDKMEAGFRTGRFYPVSMMDAATTEEMIRRGCLTREDAARHHYPLAADPIRRTA